MDNQQRQKYIIEQDIRLLEKNKQKTEQEMQRLESVSGQQRLQYNQEIKDLTKRRDDLTKQVDELREITSTLGAAYTQAKEDLQKYKEQEMVDANIQLNTVRQQAKDLGDQALKDRTEAQTLLLDAQTKKQRLDEWEKVLMTADQKNRDQSAALEAKRVLQDEDTKKHAGIIETLEKQAAELTTQIEQLNTQKGQLSQEIQLKYAEMTKKEQFLQEKEEKQRQVTQQQANTAELQAKTAKDLEDREILLKDRQGQLDRAVDEMRGKGAQI